MPLEPLIFVEVALVKGMSGNIQELLDRDAPLGDPSAADTAIFYSISNAQKGLAGSASAISSSSASSTSSPPSSRAEGLRDPVADPRIPRLAARAHRRRGAELLTWRRSASPPPSAKASTRPP